MFSYVLATYSLDQLVNNVGQAMEFSSAKHDETYT